MQKTRVRDSFASFSSHQAIDDQQAGLASIAWGPALLLAAGPRRARVRKSQGEGEKASYCSSSFLSRLCTSSLHLFLLEKETWLQQTGEGNNSRAENGNRKKRAAGMR